MKTAMTLLFEEFESLSNASRRAGDEPTSNLIDFLCERKKVALEKEKEQMIDFYKWMKVVDTYENAETYFNYTDEDMLNEYLNSKNK